MEACADGNALSNLDKIARTDTQMSLACLVGLRYSGKATSELQTGWCRKCVRFLRHFGDGMVYRCSAASSALVDAMGSARPADSEVPSHSETARCMHSVK